MRFNERRIFAALAFAGFGIGVGCASSPAGKGNPGGQGGAGGTGAQCGSTNPDDLISDFKDDNGIAQVAGRIGGWYVYGDDNGAFVPPKAKTDTSPYPIDKTVGNPTCSDVGSFHLKGTGFNIWGAAAAVNFVAEVSPMIKGSYDASMYKGISFWAKATKMPVPFVQVKFPDVNTEQKVPSPKCILSASGLPNNCSPYLVKLGVISEFPNYATTQIGTSWQRFDILFADAKQDMYNTGYVPMPDKLDVAHLLGFAIQVNANFSTFPVAANDFDIWIDDVRFIR
jgi:hypothetical protein